MSVKFDIEQQVAEEDTELVVDVPEKVVIELKQKVAFLVETQDTKEIAEMVNTAYDLQAKLGIKQKKEPENKELAEEYALAREVYQK